MILIRRPLPSEHSLVSGLVHTVVEETYGRLLALPPLHIDGDWALAWVALVDAEMAGVVLSHQDWISELWVLHQFRNLGVGTNLLRQAEAEIAERGYDAARLRVVQSNVRAVRFYEVRGWIAQREFPHEQLPTTMIELSKDLGEAGRERV